MVRLVKDVFKKFLLDPEIRKLDTDEQIYYFLMNYRNICLGEDGSFPSERLLSYKPKTTLDLINPKHNFKQNLTKNIPDDNHNAYFTDTDNTSNVFNKLRKGDLIYYKNSNKTDLRQWIPATFLMHVSQNVLQVSLGGRVISAHRRQIKVPPHHRARKRVVLHEEILGSTSTQPFASNENDTSSTRVQDEGEEAACSSLAGCGIDSSPVRDDFVLQSSYRDSQPNSKRRREEDSDSDSDFYGFAADSFVFREIPAFEDGSPSQAVKPIRKSNRRMKKRRKEDYVYY